jgi:hypothetical protein
MLQPTRTAGNLDSIRSQSTGCAFSHIALAKVPGAFHAAQCQGRPAREFPSRQRKRSHRDPVTLLGAKLSGQGWADVSAKFRTVASWFSDPTSYEFEVIAAGASGDLAYIVGYEHNVVRVDGAPKTYTLRSTHVYR